MENEGILFGVNAVREALRSGREINSLLVAGTQGALGKLAAMARENGVVLKHVDTRKLDQLCDGAAHQGVVALVAAHAYASLEDLLAAAKASGEPPFFVLCDSLEDPHNLGAVLRTADAVGVHGVIIPKRRSVALTATVGKTSAGALEYVPVARVTNLTAAIETLKEAGVWIYGACGEEPGVATTSYLQQDFSGPVALVIGAEGKGISRLVREHCDFLVSIPMRGKLNSLNASVAAGILLYRIAAVREGAADGLPTNAQADS